MLTIFMGEIIITFNEMATIDKFHFMTLLEYKFITFYFNLKTLFFVLLIVLKCEKFKHLNCLLKELKIIIII